jgi:hypothetical protein
MSGDLFELLFVIAFILIGILGGRRKKPEAQQQLPLPRSRPRPAPRPVPGRGSVGHLAQRPRPASPQTAQDALLQELEGLLTGRRPIPVEDQPRKVPTSSEVPEPEEARSLESLAVEEAAVWTEGRERASEVRDSPRWAEGREREAGSLETLEEAGEASHKRFHERYGVAARMEPPTSRGPTFDVQDVRRAIVWSEILGPPVSLR